MPKQVDVRVGVRVERRRGARQGSDAETRWREEEVGEQVDEEGFGAATIELAIEHEKTIKNGFFNSFLPPSPSVRVFDAMMLASSERAKRRRAANKPTIHTHTRQDGSVFTLRAQFYTTRLREKKTENRRRDAVY